MGEGVGPQQVTEFIADVGIGNRCGGESNGPQNHREGSRGNWRQTVASQLSKGSFGAREAAGERQRDNHQYRLHGKQGVGRIPEER